MSVKTQLRPVLILCLMAIMVVLLSAVPPIAAETDDFSLTTQVDPPGSGTVSVDPGPPYSQNQVVTLTAAPATGYTFDRWVLNDDTGWWDAGWDYRVELTAAAAGFARKNKPAEFNINFTQLWNTLGVNGTLDPNSIRVVEVNAGGDVIDDTIAFQFDQASDYHATNKAAGTLVLIMEGNTAAGVTRRYQVYFDVTGKGFAPPAVPAQVILSEQADQDVAAYKIQAATGTLFIHKTGGGISSYNDINGIDWVSWNSATGSAGQYRGIPNSAGGSNSGVFHPGKGNMTATVLNQGPIKITLHFIAKKVQGDTGRWEGIFEFYPDYTTFTMLGTKANTVQTYPFYLLYEGTPGGQLNPTTDFIVFSNGEQITGNQTRDGDLPNEEWAFVADPSSGASGRAIYLINHTDDTQNDTYFPSGAKDMTILGFGRSGSNPLIPGTTVPRKYSFGLMDETTFDGSKPVIYNVYKPMDVTVGAAESRSGASLGTQNPVQFTITGEHSITALFKPLQYTVTTSVSPINTGTVSKSPDKSLYDHGESVTLTASPTAAGYSFAGWQGDVNGMENPKTVQITKNMVVTALFAQKFTVVTSSNPVEGGSVTVFPQQDSYDPGTEITLTANANPNFTFTGWSGSFSGSENPKVVTVNGNLNIVGNFGAAQYTFNATSAGNGTVDWTPKKDFYAAGEQVTVTATPDSGFAFNGWTGSIISSINPLTIPISGNMSLVGNFVASQTYTVSVTVPGGGGTVNKNPPGPNYPAGSSVTLTAVPAAGKRFVEWGGDANGSDNPKTITVNGNMNITATFADDGYPLNITLSPPEGGVVFRNPDDPFYPAGTVVTLTVVTNAGWTFEGWTGDVTVVNDTTATVEIVEGGNNVTAMFSAPGPYTLTVTKTGDGTGDVTINPLKAEYAYGEVVKLTAVPTGGSAFTGWSGDATGTKNPLNVTMNGNKNIVANFIEPSGPFSDNFDTCGLSPRWGTPINPLGDATIGVNGTHLTIAVPEGVTHNLWSDIDTAPRIMQDADNVNFEYIVKFDTAVSLNAQMQGIVIQQDAQNFVRFDFEYNNGLKAFAMPFQAGSPINQRKISVDILNPALAVYMKIARTDNNWVMSYSGNGTDWIDAGTIKNYILNVQEVGIFAGNVASKNAPAPAHTAIVDYFQNVAQGPIGEDRPLLDINTEGNGSVTTDPPFNQLACGQTVTLTALSGAGATFLGWSGDVTGTQVVVTLLLNGPKSVTASFTGTKQYQLLLPMITR